MGESETEPLSSPEDDNSPQVRLTDNIVVELLASYSVLISKSISILPGR